MDTKKVKEDQQAIIKKAQQEIEQARNFIAERDTLIKKAVGKLELIAEEEATKEEPKKEDKKDGSKQ